MIQPSSKKKSLVSYANMSAELQAAFKEKYPRGYADYMEDLKRIEKPDGTFFYAVTVEIPDAIYLVKIDVRVDDYEDAENAFKDSDDEGTSNEDAVFPDDNVEQFEVEEDAE